MLIRFFAVTLAVVAGHTAACGDAVPMQYRWQVGTSVRLGLTAKITGSMPILQNPEPVDLDGVLRIGYIARPEKTDGQGRTVVRFRVETAEAELLGIPISVPMEDAHKVLDRVVTFDQRGQVVRVENAQPLPFTLSIPGVDPQRLYTLVCPIVFPETPVKPGDTWDYSSELLGAEGAPARFTAKVLSLTRPAPNKPQELRVGEEFSMDVDQSLGEDRKPAAGDTPVALTRKGTIRGTGVMVFDPSAGRLLRGHLTIQADITETTVVPSATEGHSESVSRIKAVLQIRPETADKSAKTVAGKPATSGRASLRGGRKAR